MCPLSPGSERKCRVKRVHKCMHCLSPGHQNAQCPKVTGKEWENVGFSVTSGDGFGSPGERFLIHDCMVRVNLD